MDVRWLIGAAGGLALAGVFAWLVAPDTGPLDLPEPSTVQDAVRERAVEGAPVQEARSTRRPAEAAVAPRDDRVAPPPRQFRDDLPTEKRDWDQETLDMLHTFQEEHRLTRTEMREVKRILHDLHEGLESNRKMGESGKRPTKAVVHLAEEMRLKSELRLVEVLGAETADALRDVHPELSGQELR